MRIKELKVLFSAGEIESSVNAIAGRINAVYKDEPLVVVCVLKGAFMFFGDLVRRIENKNLEVDFVRLSSYGSGTVSSQKVVLGKDVDIDLKGKHVLVVEDIVDTGHSMRFLLDEFADRGALDVKLAVLVDKKERRVVPVAPDFTGFELSDGFIVGYGLDCAEQYRQLPDICEVIMVGEVDGNNLP